MQLNSSPTDRPTRSRRSRRLWLLLVVVPLIAGVLGAPAVAPVAGDELNDAKSAAKALEKKIAAQKELVAQIQSAQADLRASIASTSRELKGITADLAAMRKKIAKLRDDIAAVQATYEQLVHELSELEAQLVIVEAQEAAKKEELRQRRDQLATRIRESYETEQTSILESLLAGASFTAVLEQMAYQLDIAEQDQVLAERIVQDQAALAAIRETVEITRDGTVAMRQATEAQQRELDARLRELKRAQAQLKKLEAETKRALAVQKAAYAKLARDKANLRRAMAEAAAAKERLQRQINEIIAEQASRGNIPSEYNGTLKWPMPGTISGEYGCVNSPLYGPGNGCAHYHNGIDIVNTCGTAVRASAPGTVAYIGWNYADGADPAWIVVVAHSTNLQTWYAHMAPKYPGGIQAGSSVKAGQIVGYEASTGRSTGCHLHWMVEHDGQFVNPRLFV